jgi:hypothetical protein
LIFKKTDLTRALKGVREAGMEIGRIEISKEGVIVMVPWQARRTYRLECGRDRMG